MAVRIVYANVYVDEVYETQAEALAKIAYLYPESKVLKTDGKFGEFRVQRVVQDDGITLDAMLIEVVDEDAEPTAFDLTSDEMDWMENNEPTVRVSVGDGVELCIWELDEKTLVQPAGEERNSEGWCFREDVDPNEVCRLYKESQ